MGELSVQQAIDFAMRQHQAGRLAEAEAIYRQVLALHPKHPVALHLLGLVAHKSGRFSEAVDLIGQAVTIDPNWAEAHSNNAIALLEVGEIDASLAACDRAILLKPDYADAHFNRGNALEAQRLTRSAIESFRTAAALNPSYYQAFYNLGNLLKDEGDIDGAVEALSRAVQLAPDSADAHWNLSNALLLKGEFERGWAEYEWRFGARDSTLTKVNAGVPQWDGSDLNGRTIVLHAEQGFGDTIQFVRYAPLVANRGGRVILLCQPNLNGLLESSPLSSDVWPMEKPIEMFDTHCPIPSLPKVFHTQINTIPADVPYLTANRELIEKWGARLGPPTSRLRVGLVWSGSAGFRDNAPRRVSLSMLTPLFRIGGIEYFSLQKGAPAAESANLPPDVRLRNLEMELEDFADTAAVIAHLDLVISTDTSVPHLAGALGVPVWLMLQHVPDWRWMLKRADSPWYPTMRLFRQKVKGNWVDVIEEATEAIANFKCARQMGRRWPQER